MQNSKYILIVLLFKRPNFITPIKTQKRNIKKILMSKYVRNIDT